MSFNHAVAAVATTRLGEAVFLGKIRLCVAGLLFFPNSIVCCFSLFAETHSPRTGLGAECAYPVFKLMS